MATCKECVHVGVCRYYTNELAKANGIPLKLEEVERLLECDDCENFKDRFRFVELPCKVGSHVYIIEGDEINQDFIDEVSILYNPEGEDIFNMCGVHTDFDFDEFGKVVFSTPEEAEKALKEREA